MSRSHRYMAVLALLLILQSVLFIPPTALAAGPGQPPLLPPDWAAIAGIPDPLAGLLPEGATPTASAAPGAVPLPTPPQPPACPCGPDNVSAATGALTLTHADLELPGIGPALGLARRYDSSNAGQDGPFGYGWDFSLNRRLRMYDTYDLTELRGDGGRATFRFQDGTNGAFVSSFDGDSLIHRDLSRGTYAQEGAQGWSLVREAADRYVLTRADGTVSIYHGYYAPWRSTQDPMAGRLLSVTDRNGNALQFTYDAAGHLTAVADGQGRRLTFTWSGGHIATATDHAGRTFTYTYSGSGLTRAASPDFPTRTYAYDGDHRLTALGGGPEGAVTYTYDGQDRVISAGSAAGAATYTYESAAMVYIDAAGGHWRYELDDQRRVIRTIAPGGPVTATAYTYDDQGRIATETRNGATTAYTYGAFGLPTRIEGPLGATVLRYDSHGNMLGRQDPGRPEETYAYDSLGRLISRTDPAGHDTQYAYDPIAPHGRPAKVTDPEGGVEERTYNPLGALTAVTDARGFTARYRYDLAGRLLAAVNPDGGSSAYTYDAAGEREGPRRGDRL